ncbi:MAG: HNH endonuclease [Clostridiales bacterium]|nr:HNH endonuclease [Clostridiales bacterium]
MVYVLNKNGQPLMPTKDHGQIRILLKEHKAKVVQKKPFTIQLLVSVQHYTQPISLGIDAGSQHIGVSATTENCEFYSSDVELRNDIVNLLSTRRESRIGRRNRKTRYRKPRFDNRRRPDGWLAPSIRNKIDTHIKEVENIFKILPVTNVIVEVASFDIQKINNPEIEGEGYQQGEQLNFWNTREYVLFRDGHTCQCCKGKSKDKILNVHHIESRKTGGDAPNNLITLCETCHTRYHKGEIELPKSIKRGMSFSDATFMGIMRWAFYNQLKEMYPNKVSLTYGYITKKTRIENNLEKTHSVDARCISGHPQAEPLGYCFFKRKVRCHNRQIHKLNILNGGVRKQNQAPYLVHGFRLFDKVMYNNQECFIYGRRSTGYFLLRKLDGTIISPSANYKKLKLIETKKYYITERRVALPPHI